MVINYSLSKILPNVISNDRRVVVLYIENESGIHNNIIKVVHFSNTLSVSYIGNRYIYFSQVFGGRRELIPHISKGVRILPYDGSMRYKNFVNKVYMKMFSLEEFYFVMKLEIALIFFSKSLS